MGRASVAHHQAVSRVIAAVALAVYSTPELIKLKYSATARMGPINKCLADASLICIVR